MSEEINPKKRIVRHELWYRGCPKYVVPKSNTNFWQEKVARNIARSQARRHREILALVQAELNLPKRFAAQAETEI